MWTVTLDRQVAPERWHGLVTDFGGSIFSSEAWLRTKGDDGGQPVYLRWTDDRGEPRAVAAGRSFRSRWPLLSTLDRTLILEAPPAVGSGGPDAAIAALEVLQTTARRERYTAVHVNPFTSSLSAEALRRVGFTTTERWESVIDLGPDERTLWKVLRSGHQYNVKQGRKAGLSLRMDTSLDAYLQLRSLQIASQSRAQTRGNEYTIGDRAVYARMQTALADQDIGRVFLVTDGQETVAAALITVFNGCAYYTLSGTSPGGYDLGAPTLLLWEAALRLKADGVVCLNLGGVPGEAADPASHLHGLYRFKTGFGGRLIESAGGVCVLRPGAYRAVQVIRRVLR